MDRLCRTFHRGVTPGCQRGFEFGRGARLPFPNRASRMRIAIRKRSASRARWPSIGPDRAAQGGRAMAMGMSRSMGYAVLGLGLASSMALAQVVEVERDTKLTGPKGRTIERDIKVQRGPGYVDRQVEIKRPGETLIRDT